MHRTPWMPLLTNLKKKTSMPDALMIVNLNDMGEAQMLKILESRTGDEIPLPEDGEIDFDDV